MKCTSHKRIIIRCITEYHQLCAAIHRSVLCCLRSRSDHLTHQTHRIHIDTCLCGSNVYGTTYNISLSQCLWNGTDQKFLTTSHSLAYQCRISAEEVYTHLFCRTIQRLCDRHKIFRGLAGCGTDHCDRGNRDTLVYDRNTILLFNLFTNSYQILGCSSDLIIDFFI